MKIETRSHKDLDAWKKAMTLARDVYTVTGTFPKEETYRLSAQLRRAAVSIPSNIAEGAARSSRKEYRQYVGIALGSLAEVETQLILASSLGFMASDALRTKLDEVRKLLVGLIRSLGRPGS